MAIPHRQPAPRPAACLSGRIDAPRHGDLFFGDRFSNFFLFTACMCERISVARIRRREEPKKTPSFVFSKWVSERSFVFYYSFAPARPRGRRSSKPLRVAPVIPLGHSHQKSRENSTQNITNGHSRHNEQLSAPTRPTNPRPRQAA